MLQGAFSILDAFPISAPTMPAGPSALVPLDLLARPPDSPYRPRYCILDHPFTSDPEFFETQLETAVDSRRLWEFLAYDRIQDTAGSRQLSLPRAAFRPASSCPAPSSVDSKSGKCVRGELPQKRHAAWQCDLPFVNWWHPWNPSDDSPIDELEHGIWQRACRYANKESPLELYNRPVRKDGPASAAKTVWLSLTAVYNLSAEIKRKLEIPDECHMEGVLRETPAARNDRPQDKSKLILSDRDGPWLSQLTRVADIGEWRKRFHTIFIEPKDVHAAGFETYPKGFTASYMVGREEALLAAVRSGRLYSSSKKDVLAAWGKRGGQTNHTVDALALQRFVDSWRTKASGWNVEERDLPADQYFDALSKYRFLLAPRGNGVQSPKFLEALLVGTIPITKRYAAFEDLVDYGFPMVLVDEWDEITPEALDQWWADLSPRMNAARWLATVEGMESLLFGKCGSPPKPTGCRCAVADDGTLNRQGLWPSCEARCEKKISDLDAQMKEARRSSRGLTRTSSSCQDQGLPPRDIKLDSNRKVLKRVLGAAASSAAHASSRGNSSVDLDSGSDEFVPDETDDEFEEIDDEHGSSVAAEIDAELKEINAQLAELDADNASAANASSNSSYFWYLRSRRTYLRSRR